MSSRDPSARSTESWPIATPGTRDFCIHGELAPRFELVDRLAGARGADAASALRRLGTERSSDAELLDDCEAGLQLLSESETSLGDEDREDGSSVTR